MTDQERIEHYNQTAARIRKEINSQTLDFFYRLERSKNGLFVCPICRSGTGQHHTGALSLRSKTRGYIRVNCFANQCFGPTGTDTLGALRILLPYKSEREIFAYCGYSPDGSRTEPTVKASTPEADRKPEARPIASAEEIIKAVSHFRAMLPDSPGETYLLQRGISKETMLRCGLGYDPDERAIVIPFDRKGTYYTTRSIERAAARPHNKPLSGIRQPIYNAPALYRPEPCFIVESPLCAVSIIQAGGNAVALAGIGTGLIVEMLTQKRTEAPLILCLDNDPAGNQSTARLCIALSDIGILWTYGTPQIMGIQTDEKANDYRKDPNEVLTKDGPEELGKRVQAAKESINA